MNFFKSIAALAVVAATTFTGSASAAELTSGERKLLNTITNAGVTYDVGECESGVNGWYRPAAHHIRICENARDAWSTMRHEAVHAAQHCATQLNTTVMSVDWLGDNASNSDWEFIKDAYPEEHWLLEIEAFTLQDYSNETIAQFLATACNV